MLFQLLAGVLLFYTALVLNANPVQVSLPGFQCTGMAQSIRLPSKLSTLLKLGQIKEQKVVQIQEWEGYQAIEKTIRFEGMYLQTISYTNDPERYDLVAAHLESALWNLSPFRIGQPIHAAISRVGVKNPASGGIWRIIGESESLYVEARKGKVFRIVYECYTG